jgi:hypothetical protein
MHHVDPNPLRCKRIRPCPRQADDTVLGNDVTHHPGISVRDAAVEARVELVMTIAPPRPPARTYGMAKL